MPGACSLQDNFRTTVLIAVRQTMTPLPFSETPERAASEARLSATNYAHVLHSSDVGLCVSAGHVTRLIHTPQESTRIREVSYLDLPVYVRLVALVINIAVK